MSYCKHGNGGDGCVPCAIEEQTKQLVAAIENIGSKPISGMPLPHRKPPPIEAQPQSLKKGACVCETWGYPKVRKHVATDGYYVMCDQCGVKGLACSSPEIAVRCWNGDDPIKIAAAETGVELKTGDCPFCEKGIPSVNVYRMAHEDQYYAVVCRGCGGRGPGAPTELEAINKWTNNRWITARRVNKGPIS